MTPCGSGDAAAAAAGRSPVLAAVCEQLSLSQAVHEGVRQLHPVCTEWSPEQWFESFRFLVRGGCVWDRVDRCSSRLGMLMFGNRARS
eukprot:362548-Chlamydomonas_euryale.AAC.9